MITLEKYNINHLNDFIKFVKEFQEYGDEFGMMGVLKAIIEIYGINKKWEELSEEDLKNIFPNYLDFVKKAENYKTLLKKDWVEADFFAICEDRKMIGEMIFRKRLNKYLALNSYGHISYKLKYTARGKGYGKQALNLMLDKIWKEYPHTEIIISCDINNIPSSKLIESCGGVFNRVNDTEKEYWFFKNINK